MKKEITLLLGAICFLWMGAKAQTYCAPTYNSAANSTNGFAHVSLRSINHSIGSSAASYSDYTSTQGTELAINGTYDLSITSLSGNFQHYSVFIDFNDDGDFSDPDEILYSTNTNFGSGATLTVAITIPNITPNVLTRMRIINQDGFGTVTPCGSYQQGKTADYFIFIGPNDLCNYNITANCGNNYITNVKITGSDLNNSSTCGNNGHSTFSPVGTATGVLTTGTSYFMTVTNTASSIVSCFIDFNHDLQFTSDEWFQVSASGTTGSGVISIPSYAEIGPTYMRVRSRNMASVNNGSTACTLFSSGETEDYIVDIQNSGRFPCTGAGAVMTECTGVFDDGSGVGANYDNNLYCGWLIQPQGASSITCSFYGVGFSGGDVVTVYNGTSPLAPLLGSVTGTSNVSYTANSGAMYVLMQTFNNAPNAGFTAHYTSNAPCGLPCATNLQTNNCSGNYIYSMGITSPTFYENCIFNTTSWQCVGNAYNAYAPLNCNTTSIVAGDPCDINVSHYSPAGSAVAVWVDLNQNDVFESSERVITNNSTTGSSESATFTVPSSAYFGTMKVRARLRTNGAIAASDACTSFNTGETMDYTLFIISPNSESNLVPPVAAFTASNTNIVVGSNVNFTDLSSNSPASWSWTFNGGSPSTSNAQNPSGIQYASTGCYSVTLTATNAAGNDIESQTCYINVGNAPSNCNELFFSEYLEGSSNNKALEIYNSTNSSIALSNYSVVLYANGASSPTFTQNLSGTLAPYEVFVLASSGASAQILALADITSSACNFNGNDALVLKNGASIIDVIGVVGVDPGTNWTAGSGSTLDHTLVRNDLVDLPSSNWTTGQNEWTANAVNTISDLGQHSSICANPTSIENDLQEFGHLTVYPNPSTGVFTVSLSSGSAELMVTDVLGKQILKQVINSNTTSFEIKNSGMYLLSIATKEGTFVRKLVVTQ